MIIVEINREARLGEDISVYISDNKLVPRICKEPLQLNKKTNEINFINWSRDWGTEGTEETEAQKGCLTCPRSYNMWLSSQNSRSFTKERTLMANKSS